MLCRVRLTKSDAGYFRDSVCLVSAFQGTSQQGFLSNRLFCYSRINARGAQEEEFLSFIPIGRVNYVRLDLEIV